MKNIFYKIKVSIIEKRFLKTIIKKIYPYLKGLLFTLLIKENKFKIISPKKNIIDKSDIELAKRIFDSYKAMKSYQKNVHRFYKPSSMWQKHIDSDFAFMKKSLEENNIDNFLFFLQNFGNWDTCLGIEHQLLIKNYSKNPLLKKFLSNELFQGQREVWSYYNQKKREFSNLNFPRIGNQNGAEVENNFLVYGSFFSSIHADIIDKYLKNDNHNIIADLGGGYGKLAYYVLKNQNKFTYIDFDIPETLVLASYFITKSFPNKKPFIFGEEEFKNDFIKNYDLIFLPNWEIEKIKPNSFDIFMNKNSLGEMEPDSAHNYINHIHRTSKYFFSINHEFLRNKFDNGQSSLLNKEYNINNQFKELIRYPDLGHLIYENNQTINLDSDIFFYIFEKK
tara:strand:+ start:1024 stop:2202 length:1179 start_codon:yes stop_codon:yes gene_type:complete